MITLFIGIWLQPRNQPTFSVCQLPAGSLASTFYSLKLCLSFPLVLLPALPSSLFFQLLSLSQQIYLFVPPSPQKKPLPPFLSLCAPISLGTQQQEQTCLLKKEKKNKTHAHMVGHILTHKHIIICVVYLEISVPGYNNSNICLLWSQSPSMW